MLLRSVPEARQHQTPRSPRPPAWLIEAARARERRERAARARIRAARPDYQTLRPPLELATGPDSVVVVSHHPDATGAVRITVFTPDGPLRHQVFATPDDAIQHTVQYEGCEGEVVTGRVDLWSTTDRWARGIEALRAISEFNRTQTTRP
jgi:hypothetical protein